MCALLTCSRGVRGRRSVCSLRARLQVDLHFVRERMQNKLFESQPAAVVEAIFGKAAKYMKPNRVKDQVLEPCRVRMATGVSLCSALHLGCRLYPRRTYPA